MVDPRFMSVRLGMRPYVHFWFDVRLKHDLIIDSLLIVYTWLIS